VAHDLDFAVAREAPPLAEVHEVLPLAAGQPGRDVVVALVRQRNIQ
jgi:hypothetical protein